MMSRRFSRPLLALLVVAAGSLMPLLPRKTKAWTYPCSGRFSRRGGGSVRRSEQPGSSAAASLGRSTRTLELSLPTASSCGSMPAAKSPSTRFGTTRSPRREVVIGVGERCAAAGGDDQVGAALGALDPVAAYGQAGFDGVTSRRGRLMGLGSARAAPLCLTTS
jgi:hypothetical protein